jgi:hypothetical protein
VGRKLGRGRTRQRPLLTLAGLTAAQTPRHQIRDQRDATSRHPGAWLFADQAVVQQELDLAVAVGQPPRGDVGARAAGGRQVVSPKPAVRSESCISVAGRARYSEGPVERLRGVNRAFAQNVTCGNKRLRTIGRGVRLSNLLQSDLHTGRYLYQCTLVR